MKKTKFLFDIIHPSNVHYFKGMIMQLRDEGYPVMIVARDKDITHTLLQQLDLPFISMGKMGRSLAAKIRFLAKGEFRALYLLVRYRPDIVISMASINFAHACFLLRKTFIAFDDSEHATANRRLYSPFATRIFTPSSYQLDLGKRHFRFHAFMELFYLHPNQFKRWRVAVDKKLTGSRFAIIRFVAWDAFHDRGLGSSEKYDKLSLVKEVNKRLTSYVSMEGNLPAELEQFRLQIPVYAIHSYLEAAEMYIGEGATTASECAMLGTPAIYLNPLNAGTIEAQEKEGLLFNLGQERFIVEKTLQLADRDDLKKQSMIKREKFLEKQIDPTAFFYWYLTNYPESDRTIMANSDYQFNFR